MPTGYTDCIKDDVSVNDFMLRCARGMSALIMMCDEPTGAPIPERFEPSDFYAKRLVETEKELASVKAKSIKSAEQEALKEYKKELSQKEKYIRENLILREKYIKMRTAIDSWIPPSGEHTGFKEFMLQQINSSIEFDCNNDYYENAKIKKLSGKEWKEKQIESLLRDLSRYKKENLEEIERTESRNTWIKQLRDSLPEKAS